MNVLARGDTTVPARANRAAASTTGFTIRIVTFNKAANSGEIPPLPQSMLHRGTAYVAYGAGSPFCRIRRRQLRKI